MSRKDSRATRAEGQLDTAGFLKIADKFIDLANRENRRINATQLHMALMYASTRYSAFVGKSIMEIDEHEPFVEKMGAEYMDMLRQHLADEALD
jgi:Protein of unknown function (DUF3144)